MPKPESLAEAVYLGLKGAQEAEVLARKLVEQAVFKDENGDTLKFVKFERLQDPENRQLHICVRRKGLEIKDICDLADKLKIPRPKTFGPKANQIIMDDIQIYFENNGVTIAFIITNGSTPWDCKLTDVVGFFIAFKGRKGDKIIFPFDEKDIDPYIPTVQ